MANWKYTLDLRTIWSNESLSVQEKGKAIADKLKRKFKWMLDNGYEEDLENIIDAFEDITGYDGTSPTEEFNEWMEELYDWADGEVAPFGEWPPNKKCWIIVN